MEPTQIILAPETLEALKAVNAASTFDKWLPVGAAIFGALIGGVISYLPNRFLESHKRAAEAEAVRNALITEIKSIMAIIKERQYSLLLEGVIRDVKNSGGTRVLSVRVPPHYSRVYQAQVARIGLIAPELATQVITFHQLIDAVVQDVSPGGILAEYGGDLESFKLLRDIFGRALASADKILIEDEERLQKKCSWQ